MLNEDQKTAWNKLLKWIEGPSSYFVLSGFAGTGKSYLMGELSRAGIENLYFTATTNKAAKVLSTTMNTKAKTIYSLLGIRMEEKDDKLVLNIAKKPVYFPKGSIIIIDEASMVGTDLMNIIDDAVFKSGIRIIYVGDPAQLPPVGEKMSPAWNITKNPECKAVLRQVMRNDNELLNLATKIRSGMANSEYKNKNVYIEHDQSANGEGVCVFSSFQKFEDHLILNTPNIDFSLTKVISWTNSTVNYYNSIIRQKLGYTDLFCVNEIILLAKPVERDDVMVAHTDDEFIVKKVHKVDVDIDDDTIDAYRLDVSGTIDLSLYIAKDQEKLNLILRDKADIANKCPKQYKSEAWKEFWKVKKMFDEVRYGYAMTAHRAQGSTIETCYIDQVNILSNAKKLEALQCLYVAATRPTKSIYTY
jgi:exodeoxyribonuclease-5